MCAHILIVSLLLHIFAKYVVILLVKFVCAHIFIFMTTKSNIRIVDIAQMAGVSVGTVDRILHNRGHVSEDKRERVEKILKEIDYQPNMVARFLASKKVYTLAAIIPTSTTGSYWELASEGITRAVQELSKFNIRLEYFHFDQYDRSSFVNASKKLLREKFDGVIIATLFGDHVIDLSKKLDQKEIPYAYIDSNISMQNNLFYFGGDSYVSGQIAAKLLIQEVGVNADLFFAHIKFKHSEISVQMKTRESGFLDYLRSCNYTGRLHQLELDPDKESDALHKLRVLLDAYQDTPIGGIVLNSRIYELVAMLDKLEKRYTSKIRLAGHDAIESNIKALKEGKVAYLLSQRPDMQGYDAVKALSNYLLFRQEYEKDNYMPIDILIKENIDYYKNYKL